MARSIIRNFIKLLGWLFLACATIALNCWAIVEHYLSAKVALELLGFERQEIWRDKLVGQFFGAFVPGATLPMAVALTIAAGEAVCLLIVFNYLFRIFDLFSHRREFKIQRRELEILEEGESKRRATLQARADQVAVPAIAEDYAAQIEESERQEADWAGQRKRYEEEIRIRTISMIETSVAIALFSFMFAYAINYELELFRYRSIAGIVFANSLGKTDKKTDKKPDPPEKQAVNIPAWENLPSDKVRLFSYKLAHAGAWGYLAFTALCCLALEQSIRKVGQQFDLFCLSFENQQQPAVESDGSENDSYDETSNDSRGGAVRSPSPYEPEPASRNVRYEAAENQGQSEGFAFDEPDSGQRTTQEDGGETAAQNHQTFAGTARPNARQTSEPELQEVIGSRGQRVSRDQALQDKSRYYVNDKGDIWDRKIWESIHGPSQDSDDPEPESPRAKGAAN